MAIIIGSIATVLLAFYGVLYSLLAYNMRFHDWIAETMTSKANTEHMKEEGTLRGKRMYIPRDNKRDVRVNFYECTQADPSPMLFIAHDGDFKDGDADDIDELCETLKQRLNVSVISINYSKIAVHVSTYPQEEIMDTMLYFILHASQYHLDSRKYVLCGAGAGAYLSVIAGVSLVQKGVFPNGFILIDPFLDYVALSFAQAELHPGPLALVFSGEANEKQEEYEYDLDHTALQVDIRRYPDSQRGFLRNTESADREHCIRWIGDELEFFYSRERSGS